MSRPGHADGAAAGATSFVRRVVEVGFLIALPLGFPMAWVAGVVLLSTRRPSGLAATLAMSPLGFFAPFWLYTQGFGDGAQLSPWAAGPLAAVLLAGCFVATWRILNDD